MKEEINRLRGPWFSKTREVVHSNQYGLRVIRDEVIRPNGSEGIYDYLRVKPGAYVLPFDKDENVYFVKQFRYPADKYSVEAASGGMEDGQNFLEIAQAELKQEIGIVANEWVALMERTDPAPHIIDSPQRLYLAKDLTFYKPQQEDTEQKHMEIVKMSLEDALQCVKKSIITETPTALTIMLAYDYIRMH